VPTIVSLGLWLVGSEGEEVEEDGRFGAEFAEARAGRTWAASSLAMDRAPWAWETIVVTSSPVGVVCWVTWGCCCWGAGGAGE